MQCTVCESKCYLLHHSFLSTFSVLPFGGLRILFGIFIVLIFRIFTHAAAAVVLNGNCMCLWVCEYVCNSVGNITLYYTTRATSIFLTF